MTRLRSIRARLITLYVVTLSPGSLSVLAGISIGVSKQYSDP